MISPGCRSIGSVVLRMQRAFLETPGLLLTLDDAQERFGADEVICEAVLDALVDAGVLKRTGTGAYARHVPRPMAEGARSGTGGTLPRPRAGGSGARSHTKRAA